MKRTDRQTLAQATLTIVERGHYTTAARANVHLAPLVTACCAGTRYFAPDASAELATTLAAVAPDAPIARISLQNETTLAAITRLRSVEPTAEVGALNFASAKNPGGGFLGGSEAQEESLARSSALYAALQTALPFYELHRSRSSCLYTHALIVAPRCPIIRADDGQLIAPVLATFVTAAAPNAGAIAKNQPSELPQIPATLAERAECVLAAFALAGCTHLVLGAWGCGVFRNDPTLVATTFADLLRPSGSWRRRFQHIAFAVYDRTASGAVFAAFDRALG